MHYTNRFTRTPNVKYIFSHAGGSIPYLAARFAIIDEMGFIPGGEQRGAAADMFRRIYWDTALAASDPVLRMLRDVAGINQVLYGTDFPYLRRDLAINSKQRILQSSELIQSRTPSAICSARADGSAGPSAARVLMTWSGDDLGS
jgi:aminocarboxymuconate-semialdehyde decarboxylase